MNERLVAVRLWTLGALVCLGLVAWLPAFTLGGSASDDGLLTLSFLDVGQGDATLIETPDGVQVLIDGGPNDAVLRALARALPRFDRTLDVVVATHPDSDHIGGLIDVLERFSVDTIVLTEHAGDTPTAAAFARAVEAEGASLVYARAGQVLSLGASTTLTILWPVADPAALESNTASVVAQLRYGEVEALLTGDAPQAIETYLTERYGASLKSEVLKVGHHGSRTSTDAAFVAAVAPSLAVISAGRDNRYGHPHDVVLKTLAGIETLGTYDAGTITVVSNGTTVQVE